MESNRSNGLNVTTGSHGNQAGSNTHTTDSHSVKPAVPGNKPVLHSNHAAVGNNHKVLPGGNQMVVSDNTGAGPGNQSSVPTKQVTVPGNQGSIPSDHTVVPVSSHSTIPSNHTMLPSNSGPLIGNHIGASSNQPPVPDQTGLPSNRVTTRTNTTALPQNHIGLPSNHVVLPRHPMDLVFPRNLPETDITGPGNQTDQFGNQMSIHGNQNMTSTTVVDSYRTVPSHQATPLGNHVPLVGNHTTLPSNHISFSNSITSERYKSDNIEFGPQQKTLQQEDHRTVPTRERDSNGKLIKPPVAPKPAFCNSQNCRLLHGNRNDQTVKKESQSNPDILSSTSDNRRGMYHKNNPDYGYNYHTYHRSHSDQPPGYDTALHITEPSDTNGLHGNKHYHSNPDLTRGIHGNLLPSDNKQDLQRAPLDNNNLLNPQVCVSKASTPDPAIAQSK